MPNDTDENKKDPEGSKRVLANNIISYSELDDVLMFGYESPDFVNDLVGKNRLKEAKQKLTALKEKWEKEARVKEAKLIGALIKDEEDAMAELVGLKRYPEDMHTHKGIIDDRLAQLKRKDK